MSTNGNISRAIEYGATDNGSIEVGEGTINVSYCRASCRFPAQCHVYHIDSYPCAAVERRGTVVYVPPSRMSGDPYHQMLATD